MGDTHHIGTGLSTCIHVYMIQLHVCQLHVWSATCVVGYMCGQLYMCGWLHVWSATCVVSYMYGLLHVHVVGYMCGYKLLTTEVSFMRGYTGDDSEMDRYRYRINSHPEPMTRH